MADSEKVSSLFSGKTTKEIESELLFISEPAHTYSPDRSVVLLSDAIYAVRAASAASAGRQELLGLLRSIEVPLGILSDLADDVGIAPHLPGLPRIRKEVRDAIAKHGA